MADILLTTFNVIFFDEKFWTWIQISLKFVRRSPSGNQVSIGLGNGLPSLLRQAIT